MVISKLISDISSQAWFTALFSTAIPAAWLTLKSFEEWRNSRRDKRYALFARLLDEKALSSTTKAFVQEAYDEIVFKMISGFDVTRGMRDAMHDAKQQFPDLSNARLRTVLFYLKVREGKLVVQIGKGEWVIPILALIGAISSFLSILIFSDLLRKAASLPEINWALVSLTAFAAILAAGFFLSMVTEMMRFLSALLLRRCLITLR